jgi:hypothetical protein
MFFCLLVLVVDVQRMFHPEYSQKSEIGASTTPKRSHPLPIRYPILYFIRCQSVANPLPISDRTSNLI